MPKYFRTELRKVYDTEYVKVFLLNKNDLSQVKNFLSSLESIKKVNISNDEKDLTVYPSPFFSSKECEEQIATSLSKYYENESKDINVINELNKVKDSLSSHGKSLKLYDDAIRNIQVSGASRISLDSLRLALEVYLKELLGNNCPLEKQQTPLSNFLKAHNATPGVKNTIIDNLRNLYKYNDDNVKHNDKVKKEDVDFIVKTIDNIIRQLHKYEGMTDRKV